MSQPDEKNIDCDAKYDTDDQKIPENNGFDPQQYRDRMSQEYELPKVEVNIFTLLRYGDAIDLALQLVGSVMSVCGGHKSFAAF
jgi:hypothetical protein